MRGDLPSGTVTFLFTDVEGSTRLLRELGPESYAEALAAHRRLIRDACAAQGGVEVDTQGDAFFLAFSNATAAIDASSAITEALEPGPIQVRVGLHTGTPLLTSEGYVGDDVHLAARIAASAHGGQVVLSAATVVEIDASNSLLQALSDLGEHRLKDIAAPVSIFQLGDGSFPPLKTIGNTNLPRPASTFVGREREVAEVVSLVREGARLVTLTGPGGSGKTRLAIEATAELVASFRHGTFWVGLAPIRECALVTPTIAQTLGATDGLAEHVSAKELLVLLDNMEQVVDAAPEVAGLVEACPNLTVLVTSRERLRVRGEVEYEVLPLADPDAVELFCLRSGLEASGAIDELCRRLDNMPLALELAAARTKALSPDQILDRLSERLDLFKGGRDAEERQSTLRATIEWSYDLLTRDEQRLFVRLGVFAGGCTLDSATAVAGADLDTIQSLVEKSLVRHTNDRFWMLETIREYAVEMLAASGAEEELRRRHAERCLEIAESAGLSLDALGRRPQRHELVIPEQDNVRAAIDWATEDDPALGLRLAIEVENFWITNDPAEGARRFAALLARADGIDSTLRARALRDYAGCLGMSGDNDRTEALYAEARELYREAGDEVGVASMTFRIGVCAHWAGDQARSVELYEQSLEGFRRLGDPIGELQVLGNLAAWYIEDGDFGRGIEYTQRSLEMARAAGWTWWEGAQLANLAEAALRMGALEDAERYARELLAIARRIDDREVMVFGLGQCAWSAAERGEPERALVLWSAVEAEELRAPLPRWRSGRDLYAAHIPDLPRPAPLGLEEAVEYALGDA